MEDIIDTTVFKDSFDILVENRIDRNSLPKREKGLNLLAKYIFRLSDKLHDLCVNSFERINKLKELGAPKEAVEAEINNYNALLSRYSVLDSVVMFALCAEKMDEKGNLDSTDDDETISQISSAIRIYNTPVCLDCQESALCGEKKNIWYCQKTNESINPYSLCGKMRKNYDQCRPCIDSVPYESFLNFLERNPEAGNSLMDGNCEKDKNGEFLIADKLGLLISKHHSDRKENNT